MSDKETVTIGSKVPGGLSLHVMQRVQAAPVLTDAPVAFKDLGFIELPKFQAVAAPGVPMKTESFAVVDKALWEAWLAENAGSSLVTSGSVFRQEEAPNATDQPNEDEAEGSINESAADAPRSGFAAVAPPTGKPAK